MIEKYKKFLGKSALDLDISQELARMALTDGLDLIILVEDAKYENIDEDKIRLYVFMDSATIIKDVKIG
jgi:hypothetical protein